MPGAVGDVLDQDPEAWRDAVETSAYVADNSALRKREREFLPLSPPSWKDFARFETRVVEGIGQEWEKTLSTNISAMFCVVKAAVAHMSSGSRPTVYRRPARTFVLPAPRVPDGLTISPVPFRKQPDNEAPMISYRIMGKSKE